MQQGVSVEEFSTRMKQLFRVGLTGRAACFNARSGVGRSLDI